jgi:hypothetical protein
VAPAVVRHRRGPGASAETLDPPRRCHTASIASELREAPPGNRKVAGGQRVDAPYVPYKNARARGGEEGREGGSGEGRERERGGRGGRRRGGEWGSDAGEEEAVRVGAMEVAEVSGPFVGCK